VELLTLRLTHSLFVLLGLGVIYIMPRCVCGRARCGSINRGRWAIRNHNGSTHRDCQRTGVVSRDNDDVWWVDRDGTRLCADIPENNSFLQHLFNQFLGKVRRTLNAHGRHRREFRVVRVYLDEQPRYPEYLFPLDYPRLPKSIEHCNGGAEPTCTESVCSH
jgi:hypothetical protein